MNELAAVIGRDEVQDVIDCIHSMLELADKQLRPEVGVCGNLNAHLTQKYYPYQYGYRVCPALAVGWPQALLYGESLCDFFVPVDYKDGEHVYPFGHWEGPQLERRIDLLKYIHVRAIALDAWYKEAHSDAS